MRNLLEKGCRYHLTWILLLKVCKNARKSKKCKRFDVAKIPEPCGYYRHPFHLNSWAYGLSSLKVTGWRVFSPVQPIFCYQLLVSYHNPIILPRIARKCFYQIGPTYHWFWQSIHSKQSGIKKVRYGEYSSRQRWRKYHHHDWPTNKKTNPQNKWMSWRDKKWRIDSVGLFIFRISQIGTATAYRAK